MPDYIYIVQYGDTLDQIAEQYGVSAQQISYVNQIPYPYRLAVGQSILIPVEGGVDGRREALITGYAYPFINEWILDQTLPYLSKLLIFSYGFTEAGELVPPQISEDWMLERAERAGVRAVLVLTPLGADGRFNNNLISAVVENERSQQNLINNIVETVGEKGYQGVDVDFEYIPAKNRDGFTALVENLRRRINEIGGEVSVALAPKTSADQPGLLYEGKDYRGLGEAADYVLLMTYEWGYTYGPPMAVAPINKVRQVVEYALTEIPAEKINLGVPNYGYNWTLPYEQGVSRAVTIGNAEAVQIAIENSAVIQFDTVAQSPFFRYEREGRQHEVWFEDARSIQQKYNLVTEYGLRGIGVWQLMRLFRVMWYLVSDLFYQV